MRKWVGIGGGLLILMLAGFLFLSNRPPSERKPLRVSSSKSSPNIVVRQPTSNWQDQVRDAAPKPGTAEELGKAAAFSNTRNLVLTLKTAALQGDVGMQQAIAQALKKTPTEAKAILNRELSESQDERVRLAMNQVLAELP